MPALDLPPDLSPTPSTLALREIDTACNRLDLFIRHEEDDAAYPSTDLHRKIERTMEMFEELEVALGRRIHDVTAAVRSEKPEIQPVEVAPSNSAVNLTVAQAYAKAIARTISAVVARRVAEIMGREPSADEQMLRGIILVDPARGGAAIWKWVMPDGNPDEPLCEYSPPGFDDKGRWRGAEIRELRTADEEVRS
jgi:hypothetical protein